MDINDFPGLTGFIISEIILILLTGLFALMGFWGGFAFMAMVNVLVPLWIIACLLAASFIKNCAASPQREE